MNLFRTIGWLLAFSAGILFSGASATAGVRTRSTVHPKHFEALHLRMDRHSLPDTTEVSLPDTTAVSLPDTTVTHLPDSTALPTQLLDSLGSALDSLGQPTDSLIRPTDSLTRPMDSLGRFLDSLGRPMDSLGRSLDSLGRPLDSIGRPMDEWGRSLDSLGRPLNEYGQPLDSLGNVIREYTEKELRQMRQDSIRRVRDSIRRATPRVLTAHAIPDSLKYKRLLTWTSNPYTNQLTFERPDTSFNDWYTEYPFAKEDVNATYLGLAGSPTQAYNFFKRKDLYEFRPYSHFLTYFPDVDQVTMFNSKTPYTELAYWGTLFAFKEEEESSVRFLHTQNITPAWNIAVLYKQFGAKGLLTNEATDNRGLELTTNYVGDRYTLNAGYVRDRISRNENGGIVNSSDIRDTVLDAKTLQTHLKEAASKTTRNTLFLNHSYIIPLNFRDDSTAVGSGTSGIIGHSVEYSTYSRFYKDKIAQNDQVGRDFYHNQFFINPTESADSIHTSLLDNKLFIRLQPWSDDAILSKIDGGIGYEYVSNYNFNPKFYLTGNQNTHYNNLYFYGSASGKYRRRMTWDAFAKYNLAGYNQNDYELDANATFAFYPFLERWSPVLLKAHINSTLQRPDWYSNHYYSNHYVWNNDFDRTSRNTLDAEIAIPKWKLSLQASYGLIGNHLYHDTTGILRQEKDLLNVLSVSLRKDFKLWLFHLDNEVLFQVSSKPEVLPLPMVSAHLRYYIEFEMVKNVLTLQIGGDATINTKYYAPAYNPALGTFQLQNKELIGDTMYLDAFINMQWKQVSLFLKMVNVTNGWPSHDYFSAYGYIRPQRVFKFGIHWPFYYK